jgi:hypothetical protein
MKRGFLLGWCALAGMALFAAAPAHAQASEDAVKAAFLPKFARYIELPPGVQPAAAEPFYLCIIGRDPFGALIDKSAGTETIDGHAVAVRRFASTDPEAVAGCDLAFLAGGDDAATRRMIETLRRQPTLTITDARRGKARGMIHFVVDGGRVRFHIDEAEAAERGIGISSRLLALAVDVKQRTP